MTDSTEPLSNLSESSFVILGQGSLPPQEIEKSFVDVDRYIFNENQNNVTKLDKSTCSRATEANSICEEGIQEKLNQVLKENYQLRETLSQNNLALKSQLDTFFMWQQEVLKTHESHKQKFLETKDLILKLRAENVTLKKQVEDSCSILPNGNVTDEENYQVLKPERKELIENNEKVEMENHRLKEELKVAKTEILKLNNELDDALRENRFLKQKQNEMSQSSTGSFLCGSLPNSEARAQISNLFKQLEQERAKVLTLKSQLQEVKKDEGIKLSTTEELTKYINKLDDINASLNKQNQRFNSLQSWVTLAEENVNKAEQKVDNGIDGVLMCEIKQLKSHLNQEETVSKQKQESLQEIKGQFEKLLEDYKTLQQNVNSLGSNEASLQRYKDEIMSLSEELKTQNESLKSKEEECDRLKEDIKKLTSECEDVAILRLQLDLYQGDFNNERADREKLVGENMKMAEQVRLLKMRLENLNPTNPQTSEHESSPLASPGRKAKYVCPKCMFAYSDLKTCEEHIDECLDIHMYP